MTLQGVTCNISSLEWDKIMSPDLESQADYEYPEDGLLHVNGVVPPEEISQSDDRHNHSAASLGWTGMDSFTRNNNEYGIKEVSMEIAVLPYGNTNGPFSAQGDSGSIVLDRKGRIVGMVNGGAGTINRTDVT
ncbi:hypothetical protein EV360DRAFT_72993 [Lentinula raphanica]|nr:hypothetical protein EV360DRAFT_72993 [Lentinula raphanica]